MDSDSWWLDIAGFLGVIAIMLGLARRRVTRPEEFMVADRSLGVIPLVATLVMTEFNTATLLAFSAAGYRTGPMALSLPLVFLIGLAFYTISVARAWKRFNRLSVAELFAERFSPAMGRFASTLLIVAMIGFSATYLKSLTLLMAPWTGPVNPWLASGILGGITLFVVLRGGLQAIVRTDLAGAVLTVLLVVGLYVIGQSHAAVVAPFPLAQQSVAPIAQWSDPQLPFRFVVTLIVLTCFTYITAPWYGQKIFAARSERVAFLSVGIAAIGVFLLYGLMVLSAATYREQGGVLADAQLVVPAMVSEWLPIGLRGVGFGVLFVASLTTLSGVWSAMTTMLAADFGWKRAQTISGLRTLTIGIAVLCWCGANLVVDNILDRLILANIPVAALAFAVLAGFHWPRATTAGAWASIVTGVVWGTGCYLIIGEAGGYTWPWAIYGMPLIVGVGVVVSLVGPQPLPQQQPRQGSDRTQR